MAVNVLNLPSSIPTTTVMPPTPINTINAASYAFGTIDANAVTLFNNSAPQSATIPAGFAAIGTQLTAIQFGAGQLTVVPGIGVSLFPSSSARAMTQYSIMGFFQAQLNVWIAFGNFF